MVEVFIIVLFFFEFYYLLFLYIVVFLSVKCGNFYKNVFKEEFLEKIDCIVVEEDGCECVVSLVLIF